MDNRRLFLAVLLSWAVVLVWSAYFGPEPPPPAEDVVEGPMEAGADSSAIEGRTAGPARAADDAPAPGEETAGDRAAPIEAESERIERVETERFVAELSNRGAQILSFRLKDHDEADGSPLELVRGRADGPYPFALVDERTRALPINQRLFAVERDETAEGAVRLDFRYRGADGEAAKRFVFDGDGLFDFAVEVGGIDGEWGLFFGPGVANPSELEIGQAQFWRGGAYMSADDLERLDSRKQGGFERLDGDAVRWAALDDRYFLTAVVPGEGVRQVLFEPVLLGGESGRVERLKVLEEDAELSEDEEEEAKGLALVVLAGGDRLSGQSYWGAKVYDELAALPYGLEESVDYGWFAFLARPLQIGLNYLYDNVVHNYGWAIVLMTILIKLLLLPLTHQSMVSSQKMQRLNPKIQAIRSRYRSKLKDKQGRPNVEAQREMQNEIMALYRAEKVNPAAGCLPVVLQIPVFFAFYQLLGGAIELRHAPWIAWIVDLSLKDPYYVLPIVMFASQFIQQLRMPMGTDPMQRRLFLMMPFIFLFVFLKFPAGLVLYWLTNNVFSILQQEAYKVWKARREGETESASAAKTDRKSGGKSKKKSARA